MDPFQQLEEASQAKFVGILDAIRSQGQSVLDDIGVTVDDRLSGFSREMAAMDGRIQRVNRAYSPGVTASFLVSDLLDIDQGLTTAMVRPDVKSANLRERSVPALASIKSMRFSASSGSVEQLDASGLQFRVHSDNQIPTGVFDITLDQPVSASLAVFDVLPTPAQPTIIVEVSSDAVTYTRAVEVLYDGDRVVAQITPQEVLYVRLTETPAQADDLSGVSYSFGMLDLAVSGNDYELKSQLVTKTIQASPASSTLTFTAPDLDGVAYFLAISVPGSQLIYAPVKPGDVVPVPGAQNVGPVSIGFVGSAWSDPNGSATLAGTIIAVGAYIRPTTPNGFIYRVTVGGTLGGTEPTWPTTVSSTVISGGVTLVAVDDGILNHQIVSNVYPVTLKITGDDDGSKVTGCWGLSHTDPNVAKLTKRYVGINGSEMRLVVNQASLDTGKTFTISYEYGPPEILCALKVVLSSGERQSSPFFTGASLLAS